MTYSKVLAPFALALAVLLAWSWMGLVVVTIVAASCYRWGRRRQAAITRRRLR